jgi:hypothetical protein
MANLEEDMSSVAHRAERCRKGSVLSSYLDWWVGRVKGGGALALVKMISDQPLMSKISRRVV